MDRATAQTRIDEIDAILAAGTESLSYNGRSVTYNFPSMRKERDRLQAYLNASSGKRNVRVGRYNSAY